MYKRAGNRQHIRHILVDRDGVLNRERPGLIVRGSKDWEWETGVHAALQLMARHDIALSVVTNQSAVSRGQLQELELNVLHHWLSSQLEASGVQLVGVFACIHDRGDGCPCRKPAPGLLLDAIAASGIGPAMSALVGDDTCDLFAAEAAGVRSVLVRTGKGTASERQVTHPTTVVDDLHAAVRCLIDAPAVTGPHFS